MEVTNYNQAAQLVREHGFEYFDTCNCGGTLKHNYKRKPFYMEIMPHKKMFSVKENSKQGKTFFTGKFNVLEKYLTEIK